METGTRDAHQAAAARAAAHARGDGDRRAWRAHQATAARATARTRGDGEGRAGRALGSCCAL
eukprot:3265153-Pleurochrysis_carterae.AAC.1